MNIGQFFLIFVVGYFLIIDKFLLGINIERIELIVFNIKCLPNSNQC